MPDVKKIVEKIKATLARFKKRPTFAEKFSRDGEFFGSREKREVRKKPYRRIFMYMGFMLLMAVLTLSVMLVGRLWKLNAIEVEDSRLYRAETLRGATGVEVGDEFLGFDAYAVAIRLKEELPLIENVLVYKTLTGKLRIQVLSEHTNLYYTRHNQNYYIISADDYEVLGVFSKPDEARRVGATYFGLPEATRVRVGEKLSFIDLPYEPDGVTTSDLSGGIITGTPEEEYAYVYEFEKALMESELADRVVGMETGDRYELYFVLDGNIRVRIGSMKDLDRKIGNVIAVLKDQEGKWDLSGGASLLINATNASEITFNPGADLPSWAIGLQ